MDEIKFLSVQHPALCQRTLLFKEQQLPSFFLPILQSHSQHCSAPNRPQVTISSKNNTVSKIVKKLASFLNFPTCSKKFPSHFKTLTYVLTTPWEAGTQYRCLHAWDPPTFSQLQ